MDFLPIINFLLIAGVVQAFGFNLFTIFVRKKFDKVVIFLNLIVLFISLNNLQRWLIDTGFSSNLFMLKHLLIPWYVLVFPMFYAFTSHFLQIQNKVNDFIKPTLLLFVLEIVIRLYFISYVYYNVPGHDAYLIERYTNIEDAVNLVYSVFLFINAGLLIFRKHQLLTYILEYDDLNWLKWFIRLGAVVVSFWIMAFIIKNITGNETAYIPLRLSSTILLYWIGYQGFYQYNIIKDRIVLRHNIESDKVLIHDHNNMGFESQNEVFFNEKHETDFNIIKNHIINNKLYLDPLLSMEVLSEDLKMSKSYFSKLINSYSKYNFSDFINSLRVEQAKKFLSNDEFSQYTIVAIGLECGFNSKSTFYSAFKKFTLETPTTYRAQF